MKKVLAKYRGMAKKKKNGGFTLVELIIVIAIMAVLVAILAPQYLQYVEKSKVASDNSTADQILSAAKVAASDENTSLTAGTTTTPNVDTVAWQNVTTDGTTTSTITVGGTDKANLETALASALGVTFSSDSATLANGTVIKSAADKSKIYTVKISIDNNGTPTVTGVWAAS